MAGGEGEGGERGGEGVSTCVWGGEKTCQISRGIEGFSNCWRSSGQWVEAVGGVMEELVEAVGGGRRWRQEVEELCLLLGLFWWKHLLLFDMCGG